MDDELKFLNESNAIEGVYDVDSLTQATEAWDFLKQQKQLTIDIILKTHKILMLHQKLQPNEKGYFRTIQVKVGNREALRWEKISLEIENWMKIVNRDIEFCKKYPYGMCYDFFRQYNYGSEDQLKKRNNKLVSDVLKKRHIRFEEIHPFVDGNGRIGRMLLNWERIAVGLPILVIKEEERQKYYKWFK